MTIPTPPLAREEAETMIDDRREALSHMFVVEGPRRLIREIIVQDATIATLKRERDEARAEGWRQGRDAAANKARAAAETFDACAQSESELGHEDTTEMWGRKADAAWDLEKEFRALQPPKEP